MRMRRSATTSPLALVVVAAFVAPAVLPVLVARAETTAPYGACTAPTPKASQEAAKTLFGLGRKSYEQGNDAEAIKYWRDSFDKDCNATPMLLNLANAYQRAGNNEGAILSLETYLKREPNAEDASTITARIENIRAKMKPATAAPPTASAAPTTTAAVGPATSASSDALPPPPPEDGQSFSYTPWIVAGGGLVVAAVGGGLMFKSLGDKSDIKDRIDASAKANIPTYKAGDCFDTPPGTCAQAKKDSDSAQKKAVIFGVVGGVGAAALIGGVVWGVTSLKKKDSAPAAATSLTPTFAPGYSGLSLSGSF
jgi:hypothetical protein